jgi:pimeloyl-ACP methyl ester carboxylesterase
MQSHTIRDAKYAVFQAGRGPRELVFIHGFQNDHTAWQPLIQRLDSEQYRFTTIDLLGCGESARPATWQRCTIDQYTADVVAICNVLNLHQPALVGHSLGGAIALAASLKQPARFGAVILVAPASTSGLDFLPSRASFDALAYPTPETQATLACAAFRQPLSPLDLEQLMAVIRKASPEHIEGAARSMRAFNIQAQLRAFSVPSILICGDKDRHVPLRNHLATQQAIPRCSLQVYFDCGHVPFIERPDSCAAEVHRFLGTTARQ